jgi:hypothetical protein
LLYLLHINEKPKEIKLSKFNKSLVKGLNFNPKLKENDKDEPNNNPQVRLDL